MVEPPRGGGNSRVTEDDLLTALPRRSANREVRVGLFVLLGLVAFFGAVFTFTDVGTFRGRYYLATMIDNAGGMRRGDPVQMRGVNIGRVVEFGMGPGQDGVRVRMELEDEYRVPRGSRAEVQSSGLLGGMVVNIIPSDQTETLDDGAMLPGSTQRGFMDEAANLGTRADTVLMRANALLAPQTTAAVGQSAAELQRLLAQLNTVVAQQQTQLAALTSSLRRSATGLERVTAGPDLEQSMQNFNRVTARLDSTTLTLDSASTALNTVMTRVASGQGTLGKLSQDEALYDNLNATVLHMNTAVDSLNALMSDLKANPRKYINLRVF
jgi:phospholipid/cholesterol/gamma-HCH transport system substrate-binding protein